jgi:hypothetical protein
MGGIMKKTILALVTLSALVLYSGCDPFGSTKTMTYLTGSIFTDTSMTVPAEGITVELVINPESTTVRTQTVLTNSAGVFFMEIQMYPSLPNADAGTGYSLSSTTVLGLIARKGPLSYRYTPSEEDRFTVTAGDTLLVWPIDLTSFKGGE